MSLALAVTLWTITVLPPGGAAGVVPPLAPPLGRQAAMVRDDAPPPHPSQRPARSLWASQMDTATTDLAVLIGDRRGGGQFEFGALGGGRADAPGLIHVGIGLDF